MNVSIDKLAVVHPSAEIGEHSTIGPYCVIGAGVRIGANTTLRAHVYVEANTRIGSECDIFPYVTLGVQAQDLKYVEGTPTYTTIGDRNIVREFVSIHSGTAEGSTTRVGSDCALLAHSHVAHNCQVGDHVVLSHSATLGGHVRVDDYANLGGLSAVHQNCHIGEAAMVAGMSRCIQDVLPYAIAEGFPARMRIVNKVGMERAGYSKDAIADVRRAFRVLFLRDLRLEAAVAELKREFPAAEHIIRMLDAIAASQRGLARPESAAFELNSEA